MFNNIKVLWTVIVIQMVTIVVMSGVVEIKINLPVMDNTRYNKPLTNKSVDD